MLFRLNFIKYISYSAQMHFILVKCLCSNFKYKELCSLFGGHSYNASGICGNRLPVFLCTT